MYMDEVRLYFTSGKVLRLSCIESVSGSACHLAVASKAAIGQDGNGGFRWSRGVKVLSILFVRLALSTLDTSVEVRIEGGRGSMAASLDGVLSQEPEWLVRMFGLLTQGAPRCRRLFVRSNPGRKRCGPVAVSLSQRIKRESVRIFLNDTHVVDKHCLERMLMQLTDQAR